MANNGKRKLSDYDLSHCSVLEKTKIKKAIAKRQRRWDREHAPKEKSKAEIVAGKIWEVTIGEKLKKELK